MPDHRTYIKLHDSMPDHPKIEGLSDAAFRLLIELWCYCSRHLTDGRLASASWQKRGASETRAELLAAGLVETSDDGMYLHDYTEHQRTAEDVRDLQEKRRLAGSMGGKAKAAAASKLANGVASARSDVKQSAKQTPSNMGSKSVAETETDNREETITPPRSARPPQKRGTRIPDDFTVTLDMERWAREKCPNLLGLGGSAGTRETEKFRNHFGAKSGKDAVKVDWVMTWKNWMLNADAYATEGRAGRAARPDATSDADRQYREAMARATAQEASEGQKLPAFHNQQTIMGELA